MGVMPPKFVIDADSTDDFLDLPEPLYGPEGNTIWQPYEEEGYELSDLGTLAEPAERRGETVPSLPPLVEH